MNKYRVGDKVYHPLHGDGYVEYISEHNGLHTVGIKGNRVYFALEHQLQLSDNDPKFTVQIMFTNGDGHNSERSMYQQQAETYLTDISNWDNVESITINRVKE